MPTPTRFLRTSASKAAATAAAATTGGQSSAPVPPSSSWSSTLRLPRSQFPARPIAADRAGYLERCTTQLYEWQRRTRCDQPAFVLHDGPPYANGSLHIGHALNKILKDITLRVQLARGRRIEYVPGWDCHGLPIELKALQRQTEQKQGEAQHHGGQLAVAGKEQEREGAKVGPDSYDPIAVRSQARALAEETVRRQRDAFKQWAVLGDWDNAWTTMQPDFELRQLEVFRRMVEKGLIYRRFKPVYWSPSTRTALAEGELEYKADHSSTAAFVRFEANDQTKLRQLFGLDESLEGRDSEKISFLVWTTTPWTLPANKAIAIRNDMQYVCVRFERVGFVIVAEARLADIERLCKLEHSGTVYGPINGEKLVDLKYKNDAFTADQISTVYHGDHVSAESGTGLVHTAPGHGMDDYKLGLQHGLEPFTPVDSRGRFTGDAFSRESPAEHLAGKEVLGDGNIGILKYLKSASAEASVQIIKSYKYTHSYPYDWRSKQPIIIRATAQWFADLGEIRNLALNAIEDINFIPSIGKERLSSTVRNRSEWCISRQRAWGVPIPALYRKDNGEALLTPESVAHIANTVRARGIDAWWTDEENEQAWIPESCRGEQYVRGKDTMDVWFDSGSSWTHMGRKDRASSEFESKRADVYLEGSDQHRGWFQSSILTKIAFDSSTGQATESPYKTLITHGFTLDGQGKKMSKSEGNVISPDEIINGTLLPPLKRKQKHRSGNNLASTHDALGPDALRLLVAGSDFTRDVQIGQESLKGVHSSLAKLRVTYRLLTGLLADFDPTAAREIRVQDLGLVNQMALLHLQDVSSSVWSALENYDYHKAVASLNDYINADFSAFFIEAIKDRMYCGAADGLLRKSTQFVLWHIFEELNAILRPIVPLLVEEACAYMPEQSQESSGVSPRRLLSSPDTESSDSVALRLNMSTLAHSPERPGENNPSSLEDIKSVIPKIMHLDSTIKALLEEQRAAKMIGSSLQASVMIEAVSATDGQENSEHSDLQKISNIEDELADIFVVSRVSFGCLSDQLPGGWSVKRLVEEGPASGFEVTVYQPAQNKCERCWKYLADEGNDVCPRCKDVVE